MVTKDRRHLLIQTVTQRFLSGENQTARSFDILIANCRIRIHVSSHPLWELVFPALAWQAVESNDDAPDIQIFAIEGDGIHSLSPFSIEIASMNRKMKLSSDDVLTGFDQDHSALSMYDRSNATGIFWTKSVENLPEWEFGAPLRNILTWSLLDRGIYVLHSAGIGLNGRGVLLSGPGGSGKSTTTALCIQAGFQSTGDDYCAVTVGPKPQVFAIYGLLKLVPQALGTPLSLDNEGVRKRSDGKSHFAITTAMTTALSIRALVFTEVGIRTREEQSIDSREAMLRLIPSGFSQSALSQPEMFFALSELSKATNAFALRVGPDTENVLRILERLCVE